MAGTIDNISKAAALVADSVNGKPKVLDLTTSDDDRDTDTSSHASSGNGSFDVTLYADTGVLMLPDGGAMCSRGGHCTEEQPNLFLLGGGARVAFNFGGPLGVYGKFGVASIDSIVNEGRGAFYTLGAGGQVKLLDDSITLGLGLDISWSGDPLPVNDGPSEFGNIGFNLRGEWTIVAGLGVFLDYTLFPSVGYYNSSTNGEESGVGNKFEGGLQYRFSFGD